RCVRAGVAAGGARGARAGDARRPAGAAGRRHGRAGRLHHVLVARAGDGAAAGLGRGGAGPRVRGRHAGARLAGAPGRRAARVGPGVAVTAATLLLVARAGGLGAAGRFVVDDAVRARTPGAAFPWATVVVNVSG